MIKVNILRDGHIHSPYCPHGTGDPFELYVERALEIGLEEITFTEHMLTRKLHGSWSFANVHLRKRLWKIILKT